MLGCCLLLLLPPPPLLLLLLLSVVMVTSAGRMRLAMWIVRGVPPPGWRQRLGFTVLSPCKNSKQRLQLAVLLLLLACLLAAAAALAGSSCR